MRGGERGRGRDKSHVRMVAVSRSSPHYGRREWLKSNDQAQQSRERRLVTHLLSRPDRAEESKDHVGT